MKEICPSTYQNLTMADFKVGCESAYTSGKTTGNVGYINPTVVTPNASYDASTGILTFSDGQAQIMQGHVCYMYANNAFIIYLGTVGGV